VDADIVANNLVTNVAGNNMAQLSLDNYPNPFSFSTQIKYILPESGNVNLEVFDMSGKLIQVLAGGQQSAGEHTLTWNAHNYAKGVYIIKL